MAKQENKSSKPGFGQRFVNFFKNIGKSFKNMWHELKKVSWPSRKEVLKYSLVVFVFMIVMGIIIGVIDLGAGAFIELITGRTMTAA